MNTADDLSGLLRDLRRVAHRRMRRERRGHTLQTDALVHEAYLRLARHGVPWRSRAHFFALAARLMHNVLVDHARARGNQRRGGGIVKVPLGDLPIAAPEPGRHAHALKQALDALAATAPRQRSVIDLRFFSGMSVDQTAAALGVSAETVLRDWARARRWLRAELEGRGHDEH